MHGLHSTHVEDGSRMLETEHEKKGSRPNSLTLSWNQQSLDTLSPLWLFSCPSLLVQPGSKLLIPLSQILKDEVLCLASEIIHDLRKTSPVKDREQGCECG